MDIIRIGMKGINEKHMEVMMSAESFEIVEGNGSSYGGRLIGWLHYCRWNDG